MYAAMAVATAAVLPMACKKDKDDANIDDKVLNKVITATGTATDYYKEDSIDVNSDGKFDFDIAFGLEVYDGNTEGFSYIGGKNNNNNILSNNLDLDGDLIPFATSKNSGDKINSSFATWENYAYIGFQYNTQKFGHADGTDKYFGFKFKLTDGDHYGWMKINQSADYKTLTIKELAYHKTPNTEIAVGAK